MAQAREAQLNIRSTFARERVADLVRRTGMTAAEIVEEALRAYVPPRSVADIPGLVRKGRLLVMTGGPTVSHEEAEAAIQAVRNEDR